MGEQVNIYHFYTFNKLHKENSNYVQYVPNLNTRFPIIITLSLSNLWFCAAYHFRNWWDTQII